MKITFNNLIKKSSILSLPGLISIFISLSSIPVHLNLAGPESYGNYIIFHFILMLSVTLNLGIGKSTAISINNFPKENKKISFKAIKYSMNISCLIFLTYCCLVLINFFIIKNSNFYVYSFLLLIGSIITIFFISIEGILQGNRKFEIVSVLNLFFFSLSFSVPSLLLLINNNFSLVELIMFSILIKLTTVILIFIIIYNKKYIKKSKSKILFINLKRNSKWITLNGILTQFYDLLDKYLIKYFLGPVALTIYTVPQQLTGKLSIFSKSFSAFLLPDLSKKKVDNVDFEYSLKIFTCILPLTIFILFPFYEIILKFWLTKSFNKEILDLTKIFSLSVIFSCISHILVTKFEATKKLDKNLKIELLLLPIFLVSLVILVVQKNSLLSISILILIKEFILCILRLNFLKKEVRYFYDYCLITVVLIIILFLSFFNQILFYASLIILFLIIFKKN